MFLPESSCVCIPSFRSVAPCVFYGQIPFFVVLTFQTQEEVWPHKHTSSILILKNIYIYIYIYIYMGLKV